MPKSKKDDISPEPEPKKQQPKMKVAPISLQDAVYEQKVRSRVNDECVLRAIKYIDTACNMEHCSRPLTYLLRDNEPAPANPITPVPQHFIDVAPQTPNRACKTVGEFDLFDARSYHILRSIFDDRFVPERLDGMLAAFGADNENFCIRPEKFKRLVRFHLYIAATAEGKQPCQISNSAVTLMHIMAEKMFDRLFHLAQIYAEIEKRVHVQSSHLYVAAYCMCLAKMTLTQTREDEIDYVTVHYDSDVFMYGHGDVARYSRVPKDPVEPADIVAEEEEDIYNENEEWETLKSDDTSDEADSGMHSSDEDADSGTSKHDSVIAE